MRILVVPNKKGGKRIGLFRGKGLYMSVHTPSPLCFYLSRRCPTLSCSILGLMALWGRLYSFVLLSLPPYYKSVAPKIYSCVCILICVFPTKNEGRKRIGLRGLYVLQYFSLPRDFTSPGGVPHAVSCSILVFRLSTNVWPWVWNPPHYVYDRYRVTRVTVYLSASP